MIERYLLLNTSNLMTGNEYGLPEVSHHSNGLNAKHRRQPDTERELPRPVRTWVSAGLSQNISIATTSVVFYILSQIC